MPWPESKFVWVRLFRVGDAVYAFIEDDGHDTVWRTDDGRNWVDVGPPSFLGAAGSVGDLRLTALSGGRLVAWYRGTPNTAWETTDGLNWQTVDLPPLPAGGDTQTNPVPLDSGWFANAGWKGSFGDGDIWWMKTGDTWYSLAELGIEGEGPPVFATGIDATTFFIANSGRDLWVIRLDQSE